MMTDEYILNKGYTKFPPSQLDSDIVACIFQKCFRDENGKKYFIDIMKNDLSFVPPERRDEFWKPYGYEYRIQVSVGEDEKSINLHFFNGWTLENVEEFVEKFFVNMNINYYEIDEVRHTLPQK